MAETNKMVVFQAGNEEYAIAINYVISIEKLEGMTALPHMPAYVSGLAKVRGDLTPVIDSEMVLYKRESTADEKTKMIVLKTDEISVGMIVKDAKEILEIPAENLKQPGLIAYQNTKYISGVANFDTRMILVIDPEVLIESLEGIKEIKEYMQNQKQEVPK